MKLSPMLCVSAILFATFALPGDRAFADPAVNYNSSKSNSGNFAISANDPNATEKACTDQGGNVSTDSKSGQKVCDGINHVSTLSNQQRN